MAMTPIFRGRVLDGGLLCLDRPKDYARHVRSLAGKYVEVLVRQQRTKRSNQANRWHWGIAVAMIAEYLGYDKHEHEQVHYALVAKCFGTRVVNGLEVPNVRSSRLSTAEFSELMEWEVRYAAQEWGLIIPLPNEVAA